LGEGVGKVPPKEEKEQGPLLDLVDKVIDRETTHEIDLEDIGGKLFGRAFSLGDRVKVDLGTLKSRKK
jgi:hypothetical protein